MKNQRSKINLSVNEQNNSKNVLQKKNEKLPLKDSQQKNQNINQNKSNQIKNNSKNKENQNNNNNQSSENNSFCHKIKNFFKDLWSNKLKRYITIGIISAVILVVVIIVVVVCVRKKSDSSDSNENKDNKGKTSDSNTESNEPELIDPITTGICDKPYDIQVYSDSKLKSKLKECNYQEGSELFTFVLDAIKRHNILRACHNAGPLMFNCEILKISQDYAETNPNGHSGTRFNGKWMGENLFWSWGMKLTGSYPVDDWYEEIKDYNFETGKSNGGVTGHFTQVVWKDSKELGIGYYCEGTSCVVVGNYFPGGNFNNDYINQVQDFQK